MVIWYFDVLHCFTLFYIVLHCFTLFYIVLPSLPYKSRLFPNWLRRPGGIGQDQSYGAPPVHQWMAEMLPVSTWGCSWGFSMGITMAITPWILKNNTLSGPIIMVAYPPGCIQVCSKHATFSSGSALPSGKSTWRKPKDMILMGAYFPFPISR